MRLAISKVTINNRASTVMRQKYIKYLIFTFLTIIFSGCMREVAYVLTPGLHNQFSYERKSPHSIKNKNDLTPIESTYDRYLPKNYFEKSKWSGYFIDNHSQEYFYLKLDLKNFSNEGKGVTYGSLKVYDHNHKLIDENDDIIVIRTRQGLFEVGPIRAWGLKNRNKSFYSFLIFRSQLKENNIYGNMYWTKNTSSEPKELGIYHLSRDDNYQLPIKHFKNKDIYATLDGNTLRNTYKQTNNSSIYLKVDIGSHQTYIDNMLIMNSSNKLITSSPDKTIRIWDIKTGKQKHKILGQITLEKEGKINSIAVSPKNGLLAVGGYFDGKTIASSFAIRIYDIKRGTIKQLLYGHKNSVTDLHFSDDGKYLYSIAYDSTIKIWSMENFKLLKSISFFDGYSIDGDYTKPLLEIMKRKKDTFIVASWSNKVATYSLKSSKLLHIYIQNYHVNSLAVNNSHIVVLGSNIHNKKKSSNKRSIVVLDHNLKLVRPILFEGFKVPLNVFYNKQDDILCIYTGEKIRLYNAKKNYKQQFEYSIRKINGISNVIFVNNNILAYADWTGGINLLNLRNLKLVKSFGNLKPNMYNKIAINSNIIQFKNYFSKKEKAFDILNRKFVDTNIIYKDLPKNYDNYYIYKHSINEQKKLYIKKKSFFGDKIVRYIQKRKMYGAVHYDYGFYKNLIISSGDGIISVFKLDGTLIAELTGHSSAVLKLALDGNKLISSDSSGIISLWDLSKIKLRPLKFKTLNEFPLAVQKQLIKEYPNKSVKFIYNELKKNNNPYAYSLYKVQILKPEISMYMTYDNEWVIWTSQGYFDTSQNGYKNIGFHQNRGYNKEAHWINIENLYDHFFRPDLVKMVLAGNDISRYTNGITYEEILKDPPPKVRIIKVNKKTPKNSKIIIRKNSVKLEFNISQIDNGGIGLIRVYEEGKLIETIGKGKVNRKGEDAQAILEQTKLDTLSKKRQKEYLVQLEKGLSKAVNSNLDTLDLVGPVMNSTTHNKEGIYTVRLPLKAGKNTLAVEAFNKTNTVLSVRESVNVYAKIKKRKPKIYAIVVGVNSFENTKLSQTLQYSENDAKTIAQKIKNATNYKTHVFLLLGKKATKKNIESVIAKIKKKAHLEDKILFYISTHGRAAHGQFYLAPQNNSISHNWINFEKLFQDIQSIAALDQIFIIDACESGQASDIVSSVYDAKASVLAKRSGVHVLMATTKGTYAFESSDPNIKHGVFTNKILQALDQKTTDVNHDGWISIVELSKKLQKSENDKEYQFPIIRNVGEDTYIKKVK